MEIAPRLVLLAGQPHMQDELAQRLLRDAIACLRAGRKDAALAFELEIDMAVAIYEVRPKGTQWVVVHDNDPSVGYVSREAAFEAAVMAATRALKEGFAVRIEVGPPNFEKSVQ